MKKSKEFIKKRIPLLGRFLKNENKAPIIYYHNIVPDGNGFSFMHTDISIFKQHIKYLTENGYKTYTFDEIPENFKKDPKSKEAVITFDDGFLSNYTIAYPLMKELGLKFNIFLAVGKMEEKVENYLSWEMVKEMSESGIVGFGAHTYSHIDTRKINESNYEKEITLTNDLIKKHTGKEANDFCFPYGYYNREAVKYLCEKESYKRLYTSDYMKLKKMKNSEIIGRIPISNDYNINDFEMHIKGFYDIMYYLIKLRRLIKLKR
jgi:peptidoglycan/xylan/chitin deacetylase (PgdA/CDA1 family)